MFAQAVVEHAENVIRHCLQWVNSDSEKVAAAQAAIAAEPQPVHIPRERPAPVAISNEPLVLVETRRDLGNNPLPFDPGQ